MDIVTYILAKNYTDKTIIDRKLLSYLGVTTTSLTDGATTNPIVINGNNVTAKSSDWAVSNSKDFIFNGSIWQEVGDLSNYYTKEEMNNMLLEKADVEDVYTKSDIDIKTAPTTAEINAAITDIWGA